MPDPIAAATPPARVRKRRRVFVVFGVRFIRPRSGFLTGRSGMTSGRADPAPVRPSVVEASLQTRLTGRGAARYVKRRNAFLRLRFGASRLRREQLLERGHGLETVDALPIDEEHGRAANLAALRFGQVAIDRRLVRPAIQIGEELVAVETNLPRELAERGAVQGPARRQDPVVHLPELALRGGRHGAFVGQT